MNKPVACVYQQFGIGRVAWLAEVPPDGTPLYTHQYERPHNTVLVPCDKLAEMQNEIKTLKAELSKYKQPYQYKKGMENLA